MQNGTLVVVVLFIYFFFGQNSFSLSLSLTLLAYFFINTIKTKLFAIFRKQIREINMSLTLYEDFDLMQNPC